jgi:hypothetical protein
MASARCAYRLSLFERLQFFILLLVGQGTYGLFFDSTGGYGELAEEHSAIQTMPGQTGEAGLTTFIWTLEVVFNQGRSPARLGIQ